MCLDRVYHLRSWELKEINKKIKSTLHNNVYHIEGLSGDEQVEYSSLISKFWILLRSFIKNQ